MGQEDESNALLEEIKIKNTMLASNPELYFKLYPEDAKPKSPEEQFAEDGTFVPRTEEELQQVYESFRERGLIGDGLPSVPEGTFDLADTYSKIQDKMNEQPENPDIDALLEEALRTTPQADPISQGDQDPQ